MTGIFAQAALATGASIELSILMKATVVVGLAILVTRLARRARASLRHVVLASTFGVLLTLPLVVILLPPVAIEIRIASGRFSAALSDALDQNGAAEHVTAVTDVSDSVLPRPVSVSRATLIRAAWALGATVFLVPVAVGLWRQRRIRRDSLPWLKGESLVRTLAMGAGVSRDVDILLHEGILAPLTSGFIRPAIVLPSDAQGWNTADVRRAVVHELEHVRRGDWPIHIGARVVCALYWFHPLVWTAWRHLCLESERACDDAVLQGAEQTAYAEQLVTLARRVSEARPVLSMASRSDLSARVSAVVDRDQPRGRAGGLQAAAIVAAAAVLVLAVSPLRAVAQQRDQLPGAGAKPLAFEVASVKPNKSGSRERGLGFQPGGRFFARNVPARSLIATAYGTPQALPLFRIIGGPNWIDSDAFDIEAKTEGNFPETRFEPGFSTSGELMLRTLLAERFKLTVHEETRELPLYWLVLARRDGKLGPQLRPSSGADCVPLPPPGQPPSASDRSLQPCGVARLRGPGRVSGYYATMDQIAKILELPSARAVLNRTGVPGHFSFELEFTPEFRPASAPPDAAGANDRPADIGTSLFTAVQEQLGVRLESQRGPVDVLVIDSIERPTPD